ncbi:MAG: ATP-grasp domain-containing protein [Paraglaciecola sp.]|nr:ATP-grasp domain-containing protein [Paraglaciecola sp.]
MINILVTGAGGGVGQGIIKSLKLIEDLDIRLITADMSHLASGLYAGDYSYLVPAASDGNYFEKIAEICVKEKVHYYFPGTDVELIFCAENAEKLYEMINVKIIVSDLSVIEIADDKLKTVIFLENNNFSYPKTWLPEAVEWDSMHFPLIVKPRVGCRSIGVHLVQNINEAMSAIESLTNPIVQEFIDGDEYTCTVAIYNNVISDVLCLKRDLRAGDTFRAFPVKSEIIESYVRDIAVKLNISGSCNFQLRLDRNMTPKLFEINSRFSGTTPFCSYLGFNPVEFCLKNDLGLSYTCQIDYEKIVLRHWAEIVVQKSQLDNIKANSSGNITSPIVSLML